ncbi:MAG: undecaprenyl-diphosphate phosphatase [Proteobacteria bacterium]|nr:undecaprenyl-diphosphate phosphatase [Pseudomonadota bacterium]
MLIDIFKAAFLGIIEGLTEFIPVSSTAHLLLASHLIDFTAIKNNLFEIVIQLGAILAICVIYRRRIFDLLVHFKEKSQQKFILNLILAFLPAAIIGAALHSLLKALFFNNLTIAIALILGGIVMIAIDRKPKKSAVEELEKITPLNAFYIGLFQCLAMIPGVSRSGATIIGGLLLGLNRKVAAEFSFFLAIPTIAAASLYDLYKNSSELSFADIEVISVGLIASFLSALLVIKWFINFVSKNSFVPFGIYRIIVGTLVLIFLS